MRHVGSGGFLGRLGQRGVAMVTVLLVGAVLTVVASTATFVTIQEFKSGTDDQKAGQALAIAEAGVDRMAQRLKSATWEEVLRSGCPGDALITVKGNVGTGSYSAEVRPVACRNPVAAPTERQDIEIVSTGTTGTGSTGTATRKILQEAEIASAGLPIGVFAISQITISGVGTGHMTNISMITPGPIHNRDKLEFDGYDVHYSQEDFFGTGFPDTTCETETGNHCNSSEAMPAAAHAGGAIDCSTANSCQAANTKTEHLAPNPIAGLPPQLNCTANPGGTTGQSAWDSSFNGAAIDAALSCPASTVGHAPTSAFSPTQANNLSPKPKLDEDDYQLMRSESKATGIYCQEVSGKLNCTKKGAALCANCGTFNAGDLAGLEKNFIFFVDYPTNPDPHDPQHTVSFNADWSDCNLDPDLSKTVIFAIVNGSLSVGANKRVSGAIIAESGDVQVGGGALIHGTLIADELELQGSSEYLMDDCSLRNLLGPFFTLTPTHWSELDR